jgi:hypothetical protein
VLGEQIEPEPEPEQEHILEIEPEQHSENAESKSLWDWMFTHRWVLITIGLFFGVLGSLYIPSSLGRFTTLPDFAPPHQDYISATLWTRAWNGVARGGVAGFFATVVQIICFMWLRTANTYQIVNGCGLRVALHELYEDGGVARLYQGISFAIIHAPLAKAGMTAANAGVPILLEDYLPSLSASAATITAITAACAALWKVTLIPLEVIRTMKQVNGKSANAALWLRVKEIGIGAVYVGLPATFFQSLVGTYPFLLVVNQLDGVVPTPERTDLQIIRNGIVGMFASGASDLCSNSLKVLRTMQQCSPDTDLGIKTAAMRVVRSDGIIGLFGRGLKTRLLVNIVQTALFTVLWKLFEQKLTAVAPS